MANMLDPKMVAGGIGLTLAGIFAWTRMNKQEEGVDKQKVIQESVERNLNPYQQDHVLMQEQAHLKPMVLDDERKETLGLTSAGVGSPTIATPRTGIRRFPSFGKPTAVYHSAISGGSPFKVKVPSFAGTTKLFKKRPTIGGQRYRPYSHQSVSNMIPSQTPSRFSAQRHSIF